LWELAAWSLSVVSGRSHQPIKEIGLGGASAISASGLRLLGLPRPFRLEQIDLRTVPSMREAPRAAYRGQSVFRQAVMDKF